MSARMVDEVYPTDSPLQLEQMLNHLDEQVLKVESEEQKDWSHREGPFSVFFCRVHANSPDDMDRASPDDLMDGSRGPASLQSAGADFTVWEELEKLASHPTEIDFFSPDLLASDTFEIVSPPSDAVNFAPVVFDSRTVLSDREFAI